MSTQTRVVGSGFSALYFANKPIAWLDSYTDSGQNVISAPEPVTPLTDSGGRPARHALEIATSRVVAPGTLAIRIREVWHEPVWKSMLRQAGISDNNLASIHSLPDAYDALDRLAKELTCQMVITNPNNGGGTRGKVYHGCVFTDMSEGESVAIGAMTVPRDITLMYTHCTYTTGTRTR